MARTPILLAALSIAVVSMCALAHAEEPAIVNPTWRERPTAEDVEAFYPPHAVRQLVGGLVVLACIVRVDGRPDCVVDSESPTGWGFGAAALGISRAYRFHPASRDGVPVESKYTLRIPFSLDRGYEPPRLLAAGEVARVALELPGWEQAPPLEKVEALRPPALPAGIRARAVLGCTTNADRTLDCAVMREAPANRGIGAAALTLSRLFVVAEGDQEFVRKHRNRRFTLPINFGFPRDATPVGAHDGTLIELPDFHPAVTAQFYPPAARDAGIEGRATVLCTMPADGAGVCTVESERPAGKGFGPAALRLFNETPAADWAYMRNEAELVEGDQMRATLPFTIER